MAALAPPAGTGVPGFPTRASLEGLDVRQLFQELNRLEGARDAIRPKVTAAEARFANAPTEAALKTTFLKARDAFLVAKGNKASNWQALEQEAIKAKKAWDTGRTEWGAALQERNDLVGQRDAIEAQYNLTTDVFALSLGRPETDNIRILL